MTHYAESLSNNIHIFAKPSCNRNSSFELVLKKIPIYLLNILMTLKYYFSSVSFQTSLFWIRTIPTYIEDGRIILLIKMIVGSYLL